MSVLDHKCLSCGATLPFNPKTQKWDCEYCGASYTLLELSEAEEKIKKEEKLKKEQSMQDLDCYHCPDCGAEILADDTATATFCVYCGNTNIIKERLDGDFNPLRIIPFQTTKEQAIDAFKKIKKGKIYTPKEFSKEENIQKITGVYIPFWIYDCEATGNAKFDANDIKTWRSGNYRYTKTDYYVVERSGNMEFDNVPVDGSSKFDDDTMDSIEPFDYSALKDFNMSYLSGFLSEKYDVEKNTAAERMYNRVKQTTIDELRSTIRNYSSISLRNSSVNTNIKNAEYILLPVWMLNIKFKDELYLFAMNGQTGKMVGNIPIDTVKLIVITIITFLVFFIIFSLISFLFF